MSGNFCNLLVKRRDCQVKEVTKFLLFFFTILIFFVNLITDSFTVLSQKVLMTVREEMKED